MNNSSNNLDRTPEQEAVMDRYYDAFVNALAEARQFTVSELDDVLAEEGLVRMVSALGA